MDKGNPCGPGRKLDRRLHLARGRCTGSRALVGIGHAGSSGHLRLLLQWKMGAQLEASLQEGAISFDLEVT
jgi:hypothetical protein